MPVRLTACLLTLLAFSLPASADPWKDESGHGRGWKKHGHHGHYGYGGPVIVYSAPRAYYPPPQVYYPPPQVYYPPPVMAYPYSPYRGGVTVTLGIPFGR